MRPRQSGDVLLLIMALGLSAGCARDVVDALVLPDCQADLTRPACELRVWPNATSKHNSDPWLVQHHDELVRIEPRVMVLDFYNGIPGSPQNPVLTVDQVTQIAMQQIQALALGSRYHGYSDAAAPSFLNYQWVKTVDFTDGANIAAGATFPSSSKLPLTPRGEFDATALFTQTFAEAYGFTDASGRNLALCELFEQGFINELWVTIGEGPPRGIDSLERKQVYGADATATPGAFETAAGGSGDLGGIECGVTVRIAHLSPVRGLGCDLDIRSWSVQAETTLGTVPYLHDNALAFFNSDFDTRFDVPFASWDDLCGSSSDAMPCVTYNSATSVSGAAGTSGWTIPSFIQGCGTATFPPNARYRDDYVDTTPVDSRCEHYGLHDGPGGADLLQAYTADQVQKNVDTLNAYAAQISPAVNLPGGDCGGGWQVYLRQSMPGYQNHARDSNGQPMKNWWPFLFY